MPRAVHITVSSDRRETLLARLQEVDGIVAIVVHPRASHQPAGDLVTVRGTNGAAISVVKIVSDLGLPEEGVVAIDEPVGLVSGSRRRKIDGDTSEASWEEMDTLLRRDANPSHNFLALMFLAGVVAGAGLFVDTLHIVVGAMLIAPGFEPLVRVCVGVAGGLPDTAKRGAIGVVLGYLAVAIGGGVGAVAAAWADPTSGLADMLDGTWVRYWTSFNWTSVVVAVAAGLAGGIVVNSHQTVFATGVMIALALVPGMAIVGAGIAAGELPVALRGLGRWGVDAACVLAACLLVFGIKRAILRRGAHP
ncbi:DUF389 domain-containing protein [Jannaschia formosa]|uniref:DUF389 domain-containing protein n=1 Tax=Jannaschia formosa TaxID=2259592 RepID=UPI0014318ABF|nr:DUF389 domain-containing protein [Jannaschia formosa]